jgi:hypothetical protein
VRSLFAFLLILAGAAIGSAAGARDIPFEFADGYILLHASVDAHPVTLILDSGASASALSIETARRLGLRLGETQPVDGVNASADACAIAKTTPVADGFPLGGITLALDLSNAQRLCSRHVDGLLGAGFFRGRITQIDYARHVIRLLDAAPADGEALPLRERAGVFCLPLSVNGSHPRWTRLDTGCNDALHWVVPRSGAAEKRGVSIGFITNEDDETLVSMRMGRLTLSHVPTALHGSPIFPGEAGLLGSGVLSQYRVTIDARDWRILFAQQ